MNVVYWSEFNSRIGMHYLKKMELINFELRLKIPPKKFNAQINFFYSEIFLPWQQKKELELKNLMWNWPMSGTGIKFCPECIC